MQKIMESVLKGIGFSSFIPFAQKQIKTISLNNDLPNFTLPRSKQAAPLPDIVAPIIQKNQRILQECKTIAKREAQKGMADGVDGKKSAAEDMIISECTLSLPRITHNNEEGRQEISKRIESIKQVPEQVLSKEDYLKELELEKRQKEEQSARQIDPALMDKDLKRFLNESGSIYGAMKALNLNIKQLEEQYNHARKRLQMVLKRYDNIAPHKGILDKPRLFWIILSGLFFFEVWINFTGLQDLGGNSNMGALFLGGLLAIGQAYFTKLLGKAWYLKQKRSRNFYFSITLLLFIIISGLRFGMEGSIVAAFFYLIINLLISITATLLAYRHAIHQEYFTLEQECTQLAMDINKKKHQVEQIMTDFHRAQEAIAWEIERKAEKKVEQAKETLQGKIEKYENQLRQLDLHEEECIQQLEKIKSEALQEYRYDYEQAFKDEEKPPHNPLKGKMNGKSSSSYNMNHLLFVILCACFSAMGCSSPIETEHIAVLYDQTDSTTTQDVDAMVDFIVSYSSLQEGDVWGDITVTFSQIGEQANQSTKKVSLAASGNGWIDYMFRHELEHRKKPEQFKAALRQALVDVTEPSPEMDFSYIHQNLYYRMKEMQRMQGKRIILCWSDLLLNNQQINLYHYRPRPPDILEHKDSLIGVMTADYHLAALPEVRLVNIHQPSKSKDALYEYAKRFFHSYWVDELQMEVEFRTSIPTTKPLNERSLAKG